MEIIKAGIFLQDRIFAKALAEGLSREAGPVRFYLLSAFEEGRFCDLILTELSCIRNEGVCGRGLHSGSIDSSCTDGGSCPKREDGGNGRIDDGDNVGIDDGDNVGIDDGGNGGMAQNSCCVVELVRLPGEENIFGKPPYRLYCYKESPNLLNDLLFVYFKMTGRSLENRGDALCRTEVFLSESGGCGATSIALASARMLYQIYGSRVLYLNLCPLNDSAVHLVQSGENSFLKLLYYLEQNREFPIGSFITQEEELDYVNTGIVNGYFNEMKPLYMQRFLEKAGGLGKYDFFFLDMGNHLSRENKKLLSCAECAVLVSDGERRRSEKYREVISREICEKTECGRMISVVNFTGDRWEDFSGGESEETGAQFYVSRQKDGNLQFVQNFGNEIAAIAKAIMEGADHGREQQGFSAGTD